MSLTRAEATREVLDKDGWLDTGDAGFVDEEGFLFIADRSESHSPRGKEMFLFANIPVKDIIIRGGENIASEEVENAVYQDNRVAEVASVPVPHDMLGELVAVAVSLAPGAKTTPEEIMNAAAPRLRRDARPVFVWISDELLREYGQSVGESRRHVTCATPTVSPTLY